LTTDVSGWVAVDAFPTLMPSGGIGRYAYAVAEALTTRLNAPPARLVFPSRLRSRSVPPFDREWWLSLPMDARKFHLMMIASARLGFRPDRWYENPTLVHSTMGNGPLFRRARLLATVHDLTFLTHPEWHLHSNAILLGQTVPFAVRHADRVLTDSEFVRLQVIRHFRAAPERVETMHLFVRPEFRPMDAERARAHIERRFGLTSPFLLHVGTLEPRKNHIRLIEAFEMLRRAGFPGRLVLAGRNGWRYEPIHSRIERSSEASAILHLSVTDDDDLVALYNACSLFAYPSLDEGFGLPLVEAMACGAPCVTSHGSSLIEVAGDGAALADPNDSDTIADRLITLWRDESARQSLAQRGVRRAMDFSQEKWVARLFEIYRAMLADGPR